MNGLTRFWQHWNLLSIAFASIVLPMPAIAQTSISPSQGTSVPRSLPSLQRATSSPTGGARMGDFLRPQVSIPELATRNLMLPPLGNPDSFLPIPEVEIALRIDLSDRRVYVHEGDSVKTSFPIAIGREGWETPTGEFKVMQMHRNPAWQHPFTGEVVPPGPNNPLGVRWIGFWTDGRNYIGFHGTPNEQSVGRAASHGCIRMFNRDVVRLFEMVGLGTTVTVVP